MTRRVVQALVISLGALMVIVPAVRILSLVSTSTVDRSSYVASTAASAQQSRASIAPYCSAFPELNSLVYGNYHLSVIPTITVAGVVVVIGEVSFQRQVAGIEISTGRVVYRIGSATSIDIEQIAVVGSTLLVDHGGKGIVAYEAARGKVLWTMSRTDRMYVQGGSLFMIDLVGGVVQVDLRTGKRTETSMNGYTLNNPPLAGYSRESC